MLLQVPVLTWIVILFGSTALWCPAALATGVVGGTLIEGFVARNVLVRDELGLGGPGRIYTADLTYSPAGDTPVMLFTIQTAHPCSPIQQLEVYGPVRRRFWACKCGCSAVEPLRIDLPLIDNIPGSLLIDHGSLVRQITFDLNQIEPLTSAVDVSAFIACRALTPPVQITQFSTCGPTNCRPFGICCSGTCFCFGCTDGNPCTEGDHCALLVEDRDDTKKSFSVKKEDNVLGLACPANRTLIDKKCKAVIPAKRTPHTLFIIRRPTSEDHDVAIGLGVGLGVGIPVAALLLLLALPLFLGLLIWSRRRRVRPTTQEAFQKGTVEENPMYQEMFRTSYLYPGVER